MLSTIVSQGIAQQQSEDVDPDGLLLDSVVAAFCQIANR
jgi:hypothetical protein